MRQPLSLRLLVILGTGCLAFAAGCGGPSSPPPGQNNLRDLAKYYGLYQGQNQGRTPPNEKQFKEFIQKKDAAVKPDEVFISPRDHEPYVVLYNLKLGPPDPVKGAPVVAYEKTGVGGKRMIARSTTAVEEVDEAKLKELVKGGS